MHKLQEKVYVALQRCLQKEGAPEEKLTKVHTQLHYIKPEGTLECRGV